VVKDYKVNAKRSLRDPEARLRLHILPFFGEARASAITTVDIRKFIDLRQEKEASNAEINREQASIKQTYSLAAQAGRIIQKPYIPMLKENNVRTGFFEPEQFESIRKNLSKDLGYLRIHYGLEDLWRGNALKMALGRFRGWPRAAGGRDDKKRRGEGVSPHTGVEGHPRGPEGMGRCLEEAGHHLPLGLQSGRQAYQRIQAIMEDCLQEREDSGSDSPRLSAHSRKQPCPSRYP
jgi:hypothetical protein